MILAGNVESVGPRERSFYADSTRWNHENVQAAAFKRALALKVNDMMKEKRLNKSAMAARMRTSRAAVHRLLDPKNTSVTLATLNRAARSLGCKVKIEFVPA